MAHPHHHLISNALHALVGGAMGLASAALASHFGWRSADRLPGESRRPSCLYCLRLLTWRETFPLFGWLLRTDMRTLPCPCGERKNLWPQPAAELLGFVLGIAGIWLNGWSGAAVPLCLGLGLLPAIALIDLHFEIIPDELNFLLAVFGLWWVLAGGGDFGIALVIAATLLAVGLFGALVYSRLRGMEMLGLGDVKFLAAAGLWLQPGMAPWFLALAGFSGAGAGIIWQRISGNKESPFAPALCLSLALCVLYQLSRGP